MSEFSSSDDEGGQILPVSREPDDQLLADVKAFAAGLGFSGKGAGKAGMASTDDPAFDDFAPEKAKEKLEKKPNNNLGKEGKIDANTKGDDNGGKSDGAVAAAGEKAPPLKARPEDPPKFKFDPIPEYQKEGAPPRSLLKNGEGGRWYENTTGPVVSNSNGASAAGASKKSSKIDLAAIETQRQRGLNLISAEAAAFEASAGRQKGGVGSNLQWLQQAQRGGTTSDKVAAMALLVQEAPVANLRSLDALINMAAKRGGARAVVGTALDALKELWLEVLLPPNRKLKFFEQQPLSLIKAGKEGDTALLLWAYEDALKKRYAVFVDHVDHLSRDNLEFVKDRASKTAYDLLAARPEAEAALLSTLVNKLGDPSRKLASKVGYLLTTLLAAHPGMKAVVVREVERFAFRPGLADRARYYAVVFLNQMVLTHKDAPVAGVSLARRLVDVYFTLFKLVMEGKVGTAATLAAAKREKAKKEADARAARRGKKKAAAQKKKDININEDNDHQGDAEDDDGDEKGQASGGQHSGEMDARMLSALITGVRRAFPFVAAEEVEPLIEAHADALFRLTHNVGSLGVATQALLLLHQLMSSRNSISDRFYRALYAVLASPELTRSTKAPMFLALLFKALKQDVSPRRVAAFAKRLLQVASEAPANFACGCLMLTSELLKTRAGLWNAVLQGEEKESDAVEKFKDAEEEEDGDVGKNKNKGKGKPKSQEEDFEVVPLIAAPASPASPASKAGASNQAAWPIPGSYDMRKREPQYANAERSCFWELLPLASHAHPSVAAMARTLLAGANVSYDGDPLQDLTLHAFLDKFIQKKAKVASRGDSLMQPIRAGSTIGGGGIDNVGGIVPLGGAAGAAAVGAAFSALDTRDVAPDDAFFYKFYSLQAANGGKHAKKKKKTKGGDDEEELVSDEDGDGGSEDDDAMDDFLAGEEDGGDEGIGADPDGTFKSDFDYSELEAAMKEESDVSGEESESEDDSEGDSDFSEEEEGEGIEKLGRALRGKKDVGGSESLDESGDESLDGAEFSDLSEGSSSDMDADSEEDSEISGDEASDAAADAEIAALMEKLNKNKSAKINKKRKKKESATTDQEEEEEEEQTEEDSEDDGIPEDINPFDLAEATDSEAEEEEVVEEVDGSDGVDVDSSEDEESEDDDLMLDDDFGSESDVSEIDSEEETLPSSGRGGGGRKGKSKDKPVFASADEFDDLIVRDLDGRVEEEEAEKVKADAGYRNKSSRGRGGFGGGGGARGRGRGGSGRGRGRGSAGPGTAAKRQRK